MTTYLLAGGGTAGHVNPLLALADEIRAQQPAAVIIALGTEEGLEARLVPERGYELLTIPRVPFPRRPNSAAVKFPSEFRRAVKRAREIIREHHVDVVVGFGGYASTPAYIAAKREGIPIVIHEANAKPGLANKLGARYTKFVGVTFAGTPIASARVTGMPLRPEIVNLDIRERRAAARKHFGLLPKRPTLLVTGGSLGARALNEGISGSAAELVAAGVQVLHIWGGLTKMVDPGVKGYHVIEYCDRMDLALAAADLVVSRAGSTTVSELSGLGIPAVLVPYGSGNGEQRWNAAGVVKAGGAILVHDDQLTPAWVHGTLLPLITDPDRLRVMGNRARSTGSLTGTVALFEMVQEAIA